MVRCNTKLVKKVAHDTITHFDSSTTSPGNKTNTMGLPGDKVGPVVSYGVTYISPDWCFNGLDPSTDFSTTDTDSPSGYVGGPNPNQDPSFRYYSRAACESLADGGGVYNANEECYGVRVQGLQYNASTMCAGLNNNTSADITVPAAGLDDMCVCPNHDTTWSTVVISALSVLLAYTWFVRNK